MTESLREWAPALHADDWYRALADSMDEGFCVVEVLFDEQGRPQDYRFVELNPAFEKLTGLERAAGRTAHQQSAVRGARLRRLHPEARRPSR